MLRIFLLLLFFTACASAQVPIGATKQEVIVRLGLPINSSGTAKREILSYPEFIIFLTNGRVENFQFKAGKQPSDYAPMSPVKTPTNDKSTKDKIPTDSASKTPNQSAVQPILAYGTVPKNAPRPIGATQPISLPNQHAQPPPRPLAQPIDPFAPAKIVVALMIVGAFLVTGIKIWARSIKRSKQDPVQYFRPTSTQVDTRPFQKFASQSAPLKPESPTTAWSLTLLKEIEWHRFEQLVAAYERELGHDAELTDFGPDGGVDVKVFEKSSHSLKRVIQCKAFDTQKVGVELVRAFFGAMALHKVPNGAFYTSSGFTDAALAVAKTELSLDLVDGYTFLNRIERLNLPAKQRLLVVATEGDYTTPTCPSCGVKMISRTSEKGSAGNVFWGCRNFPRCKQTFRVSKSV